MLQLFLYTQHIGRENTFCFNCIVCDIYFVHVGGHVESGETVSVCIPQINFKY